MNSVHALGSGKTIDGNQSRDGLVVQRPRQEPAEADAAMAYKVTLY